MKLVSRIAGILMIAALISGGGCTPGGDLGGTLYSPAQRFQINAAATALGPSISPPSAMGKMMIDLLDEYVAIRPDVAAQALPYYVAGGLREMYLGATTHETDGESDFILRRMLRNPQIPYWANCGSSVDLMILMLASFGVDARVVSLWHTLTDQHAVLEYYSEQFDKYVYYDPLYGVFMIDENGIPASTMDLVEQIERYGFDSLNWNYQAIRISGVFSMNQVVAADERYEFYNSFDYRIVLENYLRVLAIRMDDYTPYQHLGLGTAPGDDYRRGGVWKVIVSISGDADWSTMKEGMLDLYDQSRGGRYSLEFFE